MHFTLRHLSAVAAMVIVVPAQAQNPITPNILEDVAQRLNAAVQQQVSACTVPTLPYKPSDRTIIYARTGSTVTLGFQGDETITTVIWDEPKQGDLLQDYVHPDGRTLTVKPRTAITVPGVVTTTLRRYFLVVTPTVAGPGSPCYQGVLFNGSSGGATGFNPFGTTVQPTGVAAPSVSEAMPQPRPGDDVFTGTPNFNYTITGDASFKPTVVYDNGRFTWIQFGATVQTLPAVFYSGPNGLEVVNYTPINNGQGIIVSRLMEKIVLKIGLQEVTVTANRK